MFRLLNLPLPGGIRSHLQGRTRSCRGRRDLQPIRLTGEKRLYEQNCPGGSAASHRFRWSGGFAPLDRPTRAIMPPACPSLGRRGP